MRRFDSNPVRPVKGVYVHPNDSLIRAFDMHWSRQVEDLRLCNRFGPCILLLDTASCHWHELLCLIRGILARIEFA
jgi:hypothetical protein